MANKDILDMVNEQSAASERAEHRGCILQPGAIGDCILTLPLAAYIRRHLCPGGVDMIGRSEYLGILPGRTCIDTVRSMEMIDLHRLFGPAQSFELAERDPLIFSLGQYDWIVTFLGKSGSDFEQNLIYTAHCSRATEVVTLSLAGSASLPMHTARYHVEEFIDQSMIEQRGPIPQLSEQWIAPRLADRKRGAELLAELELPANGQVIVIHPGSGAREKCWAMDNFVAVADALLDRQIDAVFLTGPAERERFDGWAFEKMSQSSAVFEDLTLSDTLCLLSCSGGFVGNDSGITHLAGAMGLKTAAVFGVTDPARYQPMGPDVHVFSQKPDGFSTNIDRQTQDRIVDCFAADM